MTIVEEPRDKVIIAVTKRADLLETQLAEAQAKIEALEASKRSVEMHYIGACSLLAQCSVMLSNGGEENKK